MNNLDPSLAKYLSTSKQDILDEYHGKSSRKKKKKSHNSSATTAGGGLIIDDADDGAAWGAANREDEDDFVPVVEHRTTSVFRPVASTSAATNSNADGSDAMNGVNDDEAPVVVGDVIQEAPTAKSSSIGTGNASRLQGGLQTAAQLKEENRRKKEAARAEREAAAAAAAARSKGGANEDQEGGGGADETVYRDKSGRRIDTKAEKAERARQKRAELEREMAKMEWGKGLVQREDRERRQRELEDMANRPMARYADDAEMNEEMKEVQRWNDPAARFLESSSSSTKKKKGGSGVVQRPKYSGPMPAPNRFGILPGYRWDGVDRSNGFERELMQAGNKRKMRDAAARVYSTEDM